MTRLAKLIAMEEGFFRAGTLPARRNNPGDLRHSPHSSHIGIGGNDIGMIDTQAHGWEDLERQLLIYSTRGLTLKEAIYSWAPPNENDTENYLRYIVSGFEGKVHSDTPLVDILKIEA